MDGDVGAQILLNAREVAELLGISVRHVRKLDNSGRLPRPIRFGRAVRWNRKELLDWIDAGTPERTRWEALKAGRSSMSSLERKTRTSASR